MHKANPHQRLISLLIAAIILASPSLNVAQQRRAPAPRKPAPTEPAEAPPTFDTLLAADSFNIYCEVRSAGALVRSSAVTDILEPVMKFSGPSKEFNLMVNWINAHADVLASSRVLIAGWGSRPNLPNVLMAIEFPSAEDAKKFYPEFHNFLPKLFPTPTPTPSPTPTPTPGGAVSPAVVVAGGPPVRTGVTVSLSPVATAAPQNIASVAEAQPAPTPPYHMKQMGPLVLLSDKPFKLSDLRPRGSKPLEENQNFVLARNRFASESIFLYIDLKTIEKEEKDREKRWEEEEQKRAEIEAARPPQPEPSPESAEPEMTPPAEGEPTPEVRAELVVPESVPEVTVVEPTMPSDATLSTTPPQGNDDVGPAFSSLSMALFGGATKYPEAIAAAIAFEGDAYVVRTLIINSAETKSLVIPFMPQLVSGPALVPASAEIFPADTDLFVSASLDYVQVYESMIKAIADAEERSRKYARRYSRQPASEEPPQESPFAVYEKKLGLKIKDDILPLLGNELALALPKKLPAPAASSASPASSPSPSPSPTTADTPPDNNAAADSARKEPKAAEPSPVVAISIKDRDAVARLIPKIIESVGFKGANLFAQTERRDGVEIVSYGNIFVYAFVGDFLLVSADAAAVRHVVEAYLNHQTLSSDSHFRNFTRWQPRQVLGQVYVAPGLVQQYGPPNFGTRTMADDKMSDLLSRVNPVIDPLTYAVTNDGQGPLHELHLPRNLLMLMFAGFSSGMAEASLQSNQATTQSLLRAVANAEAAFRANGGQGRYGSLEELETRGFASKDYFEKYGYSVELRASEIGFELTAVPLEYGKSGKLSYFIDESNILRAGDHGGGAATVADQPLGARD